MSWLTLRDFTLNGILNEGWTDKIPPGLASKTLANLDASIFAIFKKIYLLYLYILHRTIGFFYYGVKYQTSSSIIKLQWITISQRPHENLCIIFVLIIIYVYFVLHSSACSLSCYYVIMLPRSLFIFTVIIFTLGWKIFPPGSGCKLKDNTSGYVHKNALKCR